MLTIRSLHTFVVARPALFLMSVLLFIFVVVFLIFLVLPLHVHYDLSVSLCFEVFLCAAAATAAKRSTPHCEFYDRKRHLTKGGHAVMEWNSRSISNCLYLP